jgi:hypothetical protein
MVLTLLSDRKSWKSVYRENNAIGNGVIIKVKKYDICKITDGANPFIPLKYSDSVSVRTVKPVNRTMFMKRRYCTNVFS